jgi:hypothetical protein
MEVLFWYMLPSTTAGEDNFEMVEAWNGISAPLSALAILGICPGFVIIVTTSTTKFQLFTESFTEIITPLKRPSSELGVVMKYAIQVVNFIEQDP